MQKNLVFVVGLQPKLAVESALRKQEYFGEFERAKREIAILKSFFSRSIWEDYEGRGEPMHLLCRRTGQFLSSH